MKSLASLSLLAALASLSTAEVLFKETFDADWSTRWVQSSGKEDLGLFVRSAGKFYNDKEADAGIQTSQDAHFYALSSKLKTPFSNKGKNLVVQFTVKNEQDLDCGGGYIKLLPDPFDAAKFTGDTKYNIMFGPDICGYDKKVHVIFNYKGTNHLIKKKIDAKSDTLTHQYTLIVKPDQTYQVLIDNKEEASGSLLEDWDFLPSKTIKDPEAKKPEDWDESEKIPDPEDKKPEGWDSAPEFIADPDASKPEDWDDDMDGEWEAPKVANPEFKGEWKPKMIPNPAYKGKWIHPEIPNPEYKEDDSIYAFDSNAAVGFDLWQVKTGTIFDNIIVTDSVEEAKKFSEETFEKTIVGEKKMKEEADAKEEKERAEQAKTEQAHADKESEKEDFDSMLDGEEEVKDEL